jgi:hypothetical protein
VGIGGSFPEVMWQGCEADDSLPSSAEVKNSEAILLLLLLLLLSTIIIIT